MSENQTTEKEPTALLGDVKYTYLVMSMTCRETLEVKGWSVFRKEKGKGSQWQGMALHGETIFPTKEAAKYALRTP